MEIEGKRVLITGASRGLGRALVTAFVEAGASEVIAGARKPEDREALKAPRVTPVQLDVTVADDIEELVHLGPIDILVNNAGVAGFGNPLTMDFAAVQEEMAVNYLGVLRVTRAVAPAVRSGFQKARTELELPVTCTPKVGLPYSASLGGA